MNDSMEAIRLTQLLIDVANILYLPKDEHLDRIEEKAPLTEPLNLETLMSEASESEKPSA
jgi:hypothetical protein